MEGRSMSDPDLVGETRCSCIEGRRVVAVLLDGREFVTDATGTSRSDLEAIELRVVRHFGVPLTCMRGAKLDWRTCTDCGGMGWLLRLWRDQQCA
jgi:hypothetical protein